MSAWCLKPALATHRGQRRPHNEDAVNYIYPTEADKLQQYGALFAVADGVGGLQKGHNASHLTVNALVDKFAGVSTLELDTHLQEIIQQINHRVHTELPDTSATTLTAAVFHGDDIIIAHVGDSRAYWITETDVLQLTRDHARMTTKPSGKQKAKLERAVGYRERVQVDIIRHTLNRAGALLLVTDGVTRYLDPAALGTLVNQHPPAEAVETIIRQSNAAGGIDNISAAVIRVVPGCVDAASTQQHLNAVHGASILLTLPDSLDPPAPTPEVQPPPVIDVPPPPTSEPAPLTPNRRRGVPLLALVVVLVLIGGGVYLGLNRDDAPESPVPAAATAAPTDAPTLPPTATAIPTTTPTPSPTPIPPNVGIQKGVTVIFQDTALTYVRIDDDVAAFALRENQRYTVSDEFTSGGSIWYRLLDPESEQNGWIQDNELPAYQVVP